MDKKDTIDMKTIDRKRRLRHIMPRMLSLEMLAAFIAIVAAIVMIWTILSVATSIPVMITAGIIFTICVCLIVRLLMDPDSVRARQTDSMLQLSSEMVDLTTYGLTEKAAQRICELLLPSTAALAVAITDREYILGYSGYLEHENLSGTKIRTQATHEVIHDGKARVIYTPEEIGLPKGVNQIKSAIIIPLAIGHEIRGTLKFYYKYPRKITETQKSIAQGFGTLLSTQVAASEMEEQRELATSMELKMLQNQINPHFLFNTLNTIASLIRTDPPKARILLRDFAAFYRSTLEDSQDRIKLAREIDQTKRYFSFEVARFGEDRLEMHEHFDENEDLILDMPVPPFLLQPLVENSIKHAMPPTGKLNVGIYGQVDGHDILITITDDGLGMDAKSKENILHPDSSTGLGIAVKNVHDRMHGYFGAQASMNVVSAPGEGTTITLRFPGEADREKPNVSDDEKGLL